MLEPGPDAAELRGMLTLRRAELEQRIAADRSRLTEVEARLRIIEKEGVMPDQDVVIKSVPAVRVAESSSWASGFEPQAISPVIGPLFSELSDRLAKAGITIAGPAIAYYDARDDGTVGVHACVPVNVEPAAAPDFSIVDLPALEHVATTVHHGNVSGIGSRGKRSAAGSRTTGSQRRTGPRGHPGMDARSRWLGHRTAGAPRSAVTRPATAELTRSRLPDRQTTRTALTPRRPAVRRRARRRPNGRGQPAEIGVDEEGDGRGRPRRRAGVCGEVDDLVVVEDHSGGGAERRHRSGVGEGDVACGGVDPVGSEEIGEVQDGLFDHALGQVVVQARADPASEDDEVLGVGGVSAERGQAGQVGPATASTGGSSRLRRSTGYTHETLSAPERSA